MLPDFSNTEIAFSSKSDKELKDTYRMFKAMNNPTLVKLMSSLGLLAVKLRLPFHEKIVKETMFEIFCGGISLLESQTSIELLGQHSVESVLDYGAEGKSEDEELDLVKDEVLKGIRFAASNECVPVVSTKMTALAANETLKKMNAGVTLTSEEKVTKERLIDRLKEIGSLAAELKVRVFMDAEETWIQDAIDILVRDMMREFNRETAFIYTTYQLYLKDGLQRMKDEFALSQKEGFILGAKIVRGAYMNKEREHAELHKKLSPIHNTKEDCDKDYNDGVRFCVDNYENMASCVASHNLESNLLLARLIEEKNIPKNHPHLNFCQLLGMSDYITYNLAASGYNVGKYMVYGPVRDVVPYLIRRAQENTSITGEMSRELTLIKKEMERRALL